MGPIISWSVTRENSCFNPCFGGSRGWDIGLIKLFEPISWSFNPCFGGSRGWDYVPVLQALRNHAVSILVLVDRGVGTLIAASTDSLENEVSILVLVDRGVGTTFSTRSPKCLLVFQSLFWWIEGLGP